MSVIVFCKKLKIFYQAESGPEIVYLSENCKKSLLSVKLRENWQSSTTTQARIVKLKT